jgi:hypothetical protein
MSNEISGTLANSLRCRIPAKDFYCAAATATLTTALHTYWLAIEVAKPVGELEILRSPFIPRLLLFVWLCLLVSTVALWTRRLGGLLVSMVGLIGVLGGYLLWYINTSQLLKLLMMDSFYQEHPEAIPLRTLGLLKSIYCAC